MAPPDIPFRADSAERLLQPPGDASRPNRYLAPFGACLIYAVLLGPVLLDDILWSHAAPPLLEIPVEIVVEPPPKEKSPEPPQTQPDPPPEQKPGDLSPAYDAPRAANNEKINIEDPKTEAKAPPTTQPNDSPSPNPNTETAKPAISERDPQPQPNAPEPSLGKAAETAPQGEMSAGKSDEDERPAADAQPEAPIKPGSNRLPFFASAEGLDFGAMTTAGPIAEGKAETTYTSVSVGMILARLHPKVDGKDAPRTSVKVSFSLDSMGNVIKRAIVQSSGSRALDRAALEAVGQASPFPRPPNGAPADLTFTYYPPR
jgi:TonB family protein